MMLLPLAVTDRLAVHLPTLLSSHWIHCTALHGCAPPAAARCCTSCRNCRCTHCMVLHMQKQHAEAAACGCCCTHSHL
jgi:hypothetical protein